MARKILIADDEPTIRETLADVFREQGFEAATAGDGLEAVQRLAEGGFAVALVDIRMPVLDGLQVLGKARETSPDTQVIMITAFGTVEDAVDAIKRGASDYVTKPLVFDDLLIKVNRLLDMRRLAVENQQLLDELGEQYELQSIVGRSDGLRRVLALAAKLSHTRTTALIVGESGTGKELSRRTCVRR